MPEVPLSRPCVTLGDRQVSPSLRTFQAGLLLSQGRGSNGEGGLRPSLGWSGFLCEIQAGRLTSGARVRPAGSTRTGESSLPAVITTRTTRTSGAKAANEDAGRVRRRSEAFECPGEPPGGRPLAASEREQWGSPKGRKMLLLLLSHRVATI
ncbi:MAG: hypothetical protein KA091_01120 [Methanoregulaceae archaeon]|nr:hypothetical protein [Methanoregulaceae archaeon]